MPSLLGNFVSTKYNLSSAYMPSFQKKEVGSVGQRIQLAPLAGQHTSKVLSIYLKPRVIQITYSLPTSPIIRLKSRMHLSPNLHLH